MAKRLELDLVKRGAAWHCDVRGKRKSDNREWRTQGGALQAAEHLLRCLWEELGIASELFIHTAKGVIRDRRTYGDDPRGRG